MKHVIVIVFVLFSFAAKAQKIESIYFNLYTDSLKKGVYNYISVDGKLSNGSYYPLMSTELIFSSSAGKWQGNSLWIDSAYCKDSIVITACLIEKPDVKKTITIFLKKMLVEPALKTEKELLDGWKKKDKKN